MHTHIKHKEKILDNNTFSNYGQAYALTAMTVIDLVPPYLPIIDRGTE